MTPDVTDPVAPTPRPTIPRLYLASAGMPPRVESMITPFQELSVCPSTFPAGFSVRCEVQNALTVEFYVNQTSFRKEFYAPYFLNGNVGDMVYRFEALTNRPRVRIGCRVATRRPVWVDLVKSC